MAGAAKPAVAGPSPGSALALDCANGAASALAGELFAGARRRGRRSLFARPDGSNINRDCGSTHPEALAAAARAGGFDLGFAFDGDADRALLLDERGRLHDGDAHALPLGARPRGSAASSRRAAIVATWMSNLGLERALAAIGVDVVRCDVGDRDVVETLRARGLRLGGEQSGHLVDLARSTTGDGLLTAARSRRSAPAPPGRAGRSPRGSPASAAFRRSWSNVRVARKPPFAELCRASRRAARRVEAEPRAPRAAWSCATAAPSRSRGSCSRGPTRASIGALAGELADAIRARDRAVA